MKNYRLIIFTMMLLVMALATGCNDTATSPTDQQTDDDDDDDNDDNDDNDVVDDDDDSTDDDDDDDKTCTGEESECEADGITLKICFEGNWITRDCSDDGNVCEAGDCVPPTDDDDDNDTTDDDDDTTDDDDDTTTDDDDDMTGPTYGFRADSLQIFKPDMQLTQPYPMDAKAYLNDQITQLIGNGQFNMIFLAGTDNVTDYPYDVTFGIGEAVEGGYQFQTNEEPVAVQVNQDEGEDVNKFISETTQIHLPLQQGLDITLYDATFRGTYENIGNTIADGIIAGAIRQSDANTIVIFEQGGYSVTLAQAFTMLSVTPDYTFEDNTQGYAFVFNFTAGHVEVIVE